MFLMSSAFFCLMQLPYIMYNKVKWLTKLYGYILTILWTTKVGFPSVKSIMLEKTRSQRLHENVELNKKFSYVIIIIIMKRTNWLLQQNKNFDSWNVQNRYCSASVPTHVNAFDEFSASVTLCLEHYTAHREPFLNGHFVQYAGTFGQLFMLIFSGVIFTFLLYCRCSNVKLWMGFKINCVYCK